MVCVVGVDRSSLVVHPGRETIGSVISTLGFEIVSIDGGAKALVPAVDGRPLTELVATYESQHGYKPAGGYAGIIPAYFDFGDLVRYYEAREDRQWPSAGHAWLLGCDCGEVGCWPLTARITVTGAEVMWSHFSQQHRPSRDYGGFGPFLFERVQYTTAVRAASEALL